MPFSCPILVDHELDASRAIRPHRTGSKRTEFLYLRDGPPSNQFERNPCSKGKNPAWIVPPCAGGLDGARPKLLFRSLLRCESIHATRSMSGRKPQMPEVGPSGHRRGLALAGARERGSPRHRCPRSVVALIVLLRNKERNNPLPRGSSGHGGSELIESERRGGTLRCLLRGCRGPHLERAVGQIETNPALERARRL